jgi:hypothetical protein
MSTAVGDITVRQSSSNNSQIYITNLALKVLGAIGSIALVGLIGWMGSIESRMSALAESSRGVQQEQISLRTNNDELKKSIDKISDTVNQISVGVAALQRDVAHLSEKQAK